ncbi:MAG: hypothetical protein IPH04_21075 [Saprospirales bacterium]|nr:hypothetical protein [Saprospirales bacterium]
MAGYSKRKFAYAIFGIAMFLELAMQTFWRNQFGPYWSPAVWLIAGLSVAGAALWLFSRTDHAPALPAKAPMLPFWGQCLAIAVLFLACCTFVLFQIWPVFDEFPIDPLQSDVIPSMEIYVKRLLGGEKVYRTLHFPGWDVEPTYFTMNWLPYVVPELLKIDYRWLPLGIFYGMTGIFVGRMLWQRRPIGEVALKTVLPFGALWLLIREDRHIFGHSVELTAVGFYLFLALTLFHRRTWLMALGIVPCLLSRYAFTFWLPAYFAMIWIAKGFGPAFRTGLYTLLGVVLLYIIPFWMKDPGILTRGLDYYEKTAIGQWQTQPWQEPGQKPFHLNRGLSFSLVFFDYWPGALEDKIAAARKVQFWVCLIAAAGMLIGFYFWKKRGLKPEHFGLVSLKAYLVLFYGFLHVPFSYLFLVPLFMSLPLLFEVGREKSNLPPG